MKIKIIFFTLLGMNAALYSMNNDTPQEIVAHDIQAMVKELDELIDAQEQKTREQTVGVIYISATENTDHQALPITDVVPYPRLNKKLQEIRKQWAQFSNQ